MKKSKPPKIVKRFVFFDEKDRVLNRAVVYGRRKCFVVRYDCPYVKDGLGKISQNTDDTVEHTVLSEICSRFGVKVRARFISLAGNGQWAPLAAIDPTFGWRDIETFKPDDTL